MNLIVHAPDSAASRRELMKRAADVHAQAVLDRLRSMPCPEEQKARLLDAVKARILENHTDGA